MELSVKDAIQHMNIRKEQIALELGVSYETVKKWSRENRIPQGPAFKAFWDLYQKFTNLEGIR